MSKFCSVCGSNRCAAKDVGGALPESVIAALQAAERMAVGLSGESSSVCDWYEGIEYDGLEEYRDAVPGQKVEEEANL